MVPAAWVAGRVDALPLPPKPGEGDTARAVLGVALRNPMFVVLSVAFFVCGMQLVFLTTHLPSYLDLCGMDPMLGCAGAGHDRAFNVLAACSSAGPAGAGTSWCCWGGIYTLRSLALAWYFMACPRHRARWSFAAVMGFLWLAWRRWSPAGSSTPSASNGRPCWAAWPLSLPARSFVGAFGGGLIFDLAGSYTLAWQIGVAVGLAAGLVQGGYAWLRGEAAACRHG